MSNQLFPVLAGLMWDITTAPLFSTKTHRSVSGYEVRAAMMQYPLWQFTLKYEVLRADVAHGELQSLLGFYNARLGAFDSFLYSNPDDNAVVAQGIGTGNGVKTTFQLVRAYSGFVEPVHNVNGAPSIYLNGALQSSGYTVGSTGLITFAVAPANGVVVTASFNYYYRCRFVQDTIEFNQFLQKLWEARKVELVGSVMNKV